MLADKLKQTNKHLFDAIDDHKKRLSGKNMGGAPEENRQGVAGVVMTHSCLCHCGYYVCVCVYVYVCVCECVCMCVCECVCVCAPSESEATVLQAVQAAEASLKAAEADMEVASQALREQLADARKHDGLGTLVEDFEQKVHSAVAEFQSLRGVVGHGLESGKQLVGEHREAEKRYLKGALVASCDNACSSLPVGIAGKGNFPQNVVISWPSSSCLSLRDGIRMSSISCHRRRSKS